MFRTNIGMPDRLVRIVLGLALLTLAVVGPKTPWGLVGFVMFVTGLFGTCPPYSILGIRTCKTE